MNYTYLRGKIPYNQPKESDNYEYGTKDSE